MPELKDAQFEIRVYKQNILNLSVKLNVKKKSLHGLK